MLRPPRLVPLVLLALAILIGCSSDDATDTPPAGAPAPECKEKTQPGTKCASFGECEFVSCNCKDGKVQGQRDCVVNACGSKCYVCPAGCKDNGGWDGT
jgi:hypothetical protein